MQVNNGELAAILKVSRSTLNDWLRRWPDFPVIQRGGQGQAWVFDSDEVVAFVKARGAEEAAERARREEQIAELTLPSPASDRRPSGEVISLDDRLKAERLNAIRMENAERAGTLVPIAQVKEVLAAQILDLGRQIDATIAEIASAHGLPVPVRDAMVVRFAELRRHYVERIKSDLASAEFYKVVSARSVLAEALQGVLGIPDGAA